MKAAVLALVLIAPALASAQGRGPAAAPGLPADARPSALRDIGFDQNLGARIPADITLRDEQGREVRFGDLTGPRPLVLTLVYYECPMLCTLTLNGLMSALETLSFTPGREFDVVTVSFDAREGPELAAAKKKAYLDKYGRPGAETGWHFLTGDAAQLERLTKAVGFRYAWDEETRQFAHPAGVMVVTPDGVIARYLYGIEYAPRDLRFGVIEASQNKIATALDRVALTCYRYDPMTGKYGLLTLRLVQAGGIATLLALGTFITVMRRRDKLNEMDQKQRGAGFTPATSERGGLGGVNPSAVTPPRH
jgi:protein SCO1/2